MAKIAVIFVLFALCSVTMSARITREEPNPFQPLVESLKTLVASTTKFFESQETQALVKNIQEKIADLGKKGGEQFQQASEEIKNNIDDLIKNNEGQFKEIAETLKKNFEDAVKAKKN